MRNVADSKASALSGMCIFVCLTGAILAQAPSLDKQYYENLLRLRKQFESELKDSEPSSGHIFMGSETLGGAHCDALYPIGSASERFCIYFNENGKGTVVFESRHKNFTKAEWSVPFAPSKNKNPVPGTVRKYLQKLGFAISPHANLTREMRHQLDLIDYLANYSYHSMMGGFANVISPTGSGTRIRKSNLPYSITQEEKELLTQRADRIRSWKAPASKAETKTTDSKA